MKLAIFGASGQVGLQLIKQAVWRGHTVKAFGRNVFTIKFEDEKLELIKGAVFDEKEVYDTINGCDAVLSTLGGSIDGEDKTRSLGIKNITTQMKKAGVKRIIAVGTYGILNITDDKLIMEMDSYPKQFLAVGQKHLKALQYLKESELDWTFVCPPAIVDGGPKGTYHLNKKFPPAPNTMKISSGDIAQFMLNELEKNNYIQCKVGISF
ncbi:MAG: SDR family oxidoreductase [Sphingobacteriales bacterium]|nr:SDR family oxidoreductase [Sphingobacteriales bacterium]